MKTSAQNKILDILIDGPKSFNHLLSTIGVKSDVLNRTLERLIETGIIERCQIGQGGGVRLATGAAGESEE